MPRWWRPCHSVCSVLVRKATIVQVVACLIVTDGVQLRLQVLQFHALQQCIQVHDAASSYTDRGRDSNTREWQLLSIAYYSVCQAHNAAHRRYIMHTHDVCAAINCQCDRCCRPF